MSIEFITTSLVSFDSCLEKIKFSIPDGSYHFLNLMDLIKQDQEIKSHSAIDSRLKKDSKGFLPYLIISVILEYEPSHYKSGGLFHMSPPQDAILEFKKNLNNILPIHSSSGVSIIGLEPGLAMIPMKASVRHYFATIAEINVVCANASNIVKLGFNGNYTVILDPIN